MVKSITLSEVLTSKLQFGITLTAADIIISLTITFLTALFIYLIYKKTYSGVLYSHDFNITLIIVSMVVAVIMIGISRNLALSLGLIGALSIVRFRNAVKDPKDVTFLFWAISVGIVNGVQFYKLSIKEVVKETVERKVFPGCCKLASETKPHPHQPLSLFEAL